MEAKNVSPLDRAIAMVGSQEAFADKVGVSQQAVSKWQRKGKVPAERVVDAERATGGKILRHEFRPDLYTPSNRHRRSKPA